MFQTSENRTRLHEVLRVQDLKRRQDRMRMRSSPRSDHAFRASARCAELRTSRRRRSAQLERFVPLPGKTRGVFCAAEPI